MEAGEATTTMATTRQAWEHPTHAEAPTALHPIRPLLVEAASEGVGEGTTGRPAEAGITTTAEVEEDTMQEGIPPAEWAELQRTTLLLELPLDRPMPRHPISTVRLRMAHRILVLGMGTKEDLVARGHTPLRQTPLTRMVVMLRL